MNGRDILRQVATVAASVHTAPHRHVRVGFHPLDPGRAVDLDPTLPLDDAYTAAIMHLPPGAWFAVPLADGSRLRFTLNPIVRRAA